MTMAHAGMVLLVGGMTTRVIVQNKATHQTLLHIVTLPMVAILVGIPFHIADKGLSNSHLGRQTDLGVSEYHDSRSQGSNYYQRNS